MANLKENIKDIFRIIGYILFIILIIILIYQVIRAIIGGTWQTENIILTALGIIITGLFVIAGFLINQGRTIGILLERTKNIGNSISNLGRDFKEHIREFHKK